MAGKIRKTFHETGRRVRGNALLVLLYSVVL